MANHQIFTCEVLLLVAHCRHSEGSYMIAPVPDTLPDFCGGHGDILTFGPIEFARKAVNRILTCLQVNIKNKS